MRKSIIACILLAISIILSMMARAISWFPDWYYHYIYRPVSTVFAWVFGWFPFSVVELLLYAAILFVVVIIVRAMIKRHRNSKQGKSLKGGVLRGVETLFLAVSILCFLYVVNCGVNYHKKSFAQEEGFETKAYDKQELIDVCTVLTSKINELADKLPVDENGITYIDGNKEKLAKEAMKNLSGTYTSLSGYYPNPKGLLIAELLSYQDITGIYSPFTVEANYNSDMPEYLKPFTMCHELSHLKGVMREEEANFVGFLACVESEEPSFQYSGYMNAYSYCMSELLNYDTESYSKIRKQLCEQANKDILNKHEFWEKYDTKIATISNKVNDVYLKANAQTEGTNSYNQVTGLILSYYSKK